MSVPRLATVRVSPCQLHVSAVHVSDAHVSDVHSVHVSVGGAGRRVRCNPRLHEHAQRVIGCDLVELKYPRALCAYGAGGGVAPSGDAEGGRMRSVANV